MKVFKLLILMLLLFPLTTYAEQNNIMVYCPSNVQKDEQFICEIIGYSDFEVSAIEYQFKVDEKYEKIDFIVDSTWEGSELNNIVLLYTDENKIGKFNIGKIVLKSKEDKKNPQVETIKLTFGDKKFNEIVIVDNVNNMESKKEKKPTEKNNYFKYVIILMIIGVLFVFGVLCMKKR